MVLSIRKSLIIALFGEVVALQSASMSRALRTGANHGHKMLLSLDLDGNFFDADNGPSKTNMDAVFAAEAAGIEVVINTAREIPSAQKKMPDLDLSTRPGVYGNGSVVIGKGGQVVDCAVFSRDELENFRRICEKYDMAIVVNADAGKVSYGVGNPARIQAMKDRWGVEFDAITFDEMVQRDDILSGVRFLWDKPVENSARDTSGVALEAILDEEGPQPSDGHASSIYKEAYPDGSDGSCVLVGIEGVNKRTGLEKLAIHLNIPADMDHVIHMGDQDADAMCFSQFRGIAPDNAMESCQAKAHHITSAHNHPQNPAVYSTIRWLIPLMTLGVRPQDRFTNFPVYDKTHTEVAKSSQARTVWCSNAGRVGLAASGALLAALAWQQYFNSAL